MKKTLNVHFSANLVDDSIVKFLKQEFDINIVNLPQNEINNPKKETVELLKTIDLIIFTGGEDINPSYYDENVGKYTYINNKRDTLEFGLLNSRKLPSSIIRNIPKLGICRGGQLLTVYNGGKLIQHVEGHKNNNQVIEIVVEKEFILNIEVSSDHHQMMFPYNLPESHYELIGYSKKFQSNTYLNGANEEIKLPKNFLEPEIIYYKNKNSLCIQAHPEWCIGSEGSNYCLKLINKYLLKNKDKNEKESLYSLPEGLPEGTFPLGWNATDADGIHYKFDGEKFIEAEVFNQRKLQKQINELKKKSPTVFSWPVSSYDSFSEKGEKITDEIKLPDVDIVYIEPPIVTESLNYYEQGVQAAIETENGKTTF
jgi:gamma-glutamyl-gamma-aminobutyrate hydrolase PuuD